MECELSDKIYSKINFKPVMRSSVRGFVLVGNPEIGDVFG
jgi:hypothetical protein